MDCLVCSFCFRFVGSIELQIGRKLYFQDLGVSSNHQCDEMEPSSPMSDDCCETESDDDQEIAFKNDEHMGGCSSSSSKGAAALPKGLVESLMNGGLSLPCSNEFAMPPAIPCSGGCGETFYCR